MLSRVSDKEGIDRKRRKVLPGMGPSTYNPDEGRGDGGSGFGPGNGNGNSPFRNSDSRIADSKSLGVMPEQKR